MSAGQGGKGGRAPDTHCRWVHGWAQGQGRLQRHLTVSAAAPFERASPSRQAAPTCSSVSHSRILRRCKVNFWLLPCLGQVFRTARRGAQLTPVRLQVHSAPFAARWAALCQPWCRVTGDQALTARFASIIGRVGSSCLLGAKLLSGPVSGAAHCFALGQQAQWSLKLASYAGPSATELAQPGASSRACAPAASLTQLFSSA